MKFLIRSQTSGLTVEIREWISNFTPHFVMDATIVHVEIKTNPW